MSIRPMGERAFLVETGSLDETLAVHRGLAATRPDGVVELVPAARTVLVVVDRTRLPLRAAQTWALGARPVEAAPTDAVEVAIDVVYDGPDLEETAALLGLRPAELAARHAAAVWTVAFTGFAPGFGYLVSDDWPFDVPRLATPRTRVPAGALGLAAGFSGAYPRATPGGWRLIGSTEAALFDPSRPDPALLVPGALVRFRPHRSAAVASAPASAAAPGPALADAPGPAVAVAAAPAVAAALAPAETARPHRRVETAGVACGLDVPVRSRGQGEGFEVVAAGLLATVQDLGRPGAAALGVARSGALDRGALRAANRLVGNDEAAAGIEVSLGGFDAVAERDLWFAVAGASGPIDVDGAPVAPYEAHAWPRGARLRIGAPDHGIRSVLAVRGGVEGPAVLGSRATDTMAGLGPPALAPGDRVGVGPAPEASVPPSDVAPWSPPPDGLDLRVAPGPRADWLDDPDGLFDGVWTVGTGDRVGVRLEGSPLTRRAGELASEGTVPGAIQLPPGGRPVVLLADGPVTGGYPVVGVVVEDDLDLLAQARPGTRVRFRHARPLG